MAHVTLQDKPSGIVAKVAVRYSNKKFGKLVDPVAAALSHRGVLVASGVLETAVEKGWRRLDPSLRWLAVQAAAGEIGCSWCTDFGYYLGVNEGIDPQKVRDVPTFATSAVYTDCERAVLDYAVAASATPVMVADELVGRLHDHLNDAEIVELAAWVALENYRSRFNAGLGLHSQGFSDSCQIPAAFSGVTAAR